MNIIHTKSYCLPAVNKDEVVRYCGAKQNSSELCELIELCLKEADGKISARVCYREYSAFIGEEISDLGFTNTASSLIKRHLGGCDKIILFAATVGLETDRLISKYSRISPSKALVFSAIGAERIEALCDVFENEMRLKYKTESKNVTSRISAGYGDIPLELQKDIFLSLNCSKNIGVSLNESLLMSPSKSVTAIMGISALPCCADSGCFGCSKQNCEFRRTK